MAEQCESVAEQVDAGQDDAEEREADAYLEAMQQKARERRAERAREAAKVAAARMSQDVPLCPTSDTNLSPILPEEPGDGLSPAQRLALAAIVSGCNYSMAARAADVDRRTVYRWRQERAFRLVLDELATESLDVISTRVRNVMMKMTRVLSESLSGEGSFNSAIRIANSTRLWNALHAGRPKEDDAPPADALPTDTPEPIVTPAPPPHPAISSTARAKIARAVHLPTSLAIDPLAGSEPIGSVLRRAPSAAGCGPAPAPPSPPAPRPAG